MPTTICYRSARDAAQAVRDELRSLGHESMTARPYQRHRPDSTTWWVVPSTDWPAYPHGKLYFASTDEPQALACGLFVEKGLDRKVVAGASRTGASIMTDEWQWHTFLAALGTPVFWAACDTVSRATGSPVTVEVAAHYVLDAGEHDPDAPRSVRDEIAFEVDGSGLKVYDKPDLPLGILRRPSTSTTLRELAEALRGLKDGGFVWLDVFVGSVVGTASDDGAGLDASSLWAVALSAWEPWFAPAR